MISIWGFAFGSCVTNQGVGAVWLTNQLASINLKPRYVVFKTIEFYMQYWFALSVAYVS